MRHGRTISIRNCQLRDIRNNSRKLVVIATCNEREMIRLAQEKLYDKDGRGFRILEKRKQLLHRQIRRSICQCSICSEIEEDMVYHFKWESWYCVNCFYREMEAHRSKNWFNNGIVVNEKVQRPCIVLSWCPYGSLIEAFQIGGSSERFRCSLFDHDCPVFYVSEQVTEQSLIPPIKNSDLRESLRDVPSFYDIQIINHRFSKPCKSLKYCPYGSLGDKFKFRAKTSKYACKVYPHNCPVFYHAIYISEDFKSNIRID